MKTPKYGRMRVADFEFWSDHARRLMPARKAEQHIAVLRLLTDFPADRQRIAARAAAADVQAEGGDDPYGGFGYLWPAATPEQAEQRREEAMQAAAREAELDEDEDALFTALFGPGAS
jgi:hypothetical protein